MGKFRISTPASSAGLMRFSDVGTGGGIQVEPQHVLIAAIVIIVGVAVLRMIIG
ncbi:MAG: preprotein translocase subunit Sec61beta [Candidatus Micrarchaeia archaeon]